MVCRRKLLHPQPLKAIGMTREQFPRDLRKKLIAAGHIPVEPGDYYIRYGRFFKSPIGRASGTIYLSMVPFGFTSNNTLGRLEEFPKGITQEMSGGRLPPFDVWVGVTDAIHPPAAAIRISTPQKQP